MTNTELTTWPVDVLEQLHTAIDKRIGEIRIDAIHRDKIIKDAKESGDYSSGFMDKLLEGLEKDRGDLDKLIQAKCAVYNAMKVNS